MKIMNRFQQNDFWNHLGFSVIRNSGAFRTFGTIGYTEELRPFEPSSIENRARSSFFESPDILSFVFLLERPRLVRQRLYRNSRSIVPFFWSRARFNNCLDSRKPEVPVFIFPRLLILFTLWPRKRKEEEEIWSPVLGCQFFSSEQILPLKKNDFITKN